jgi:hypothetical protein
VSRSGTFLLAGLRWLLAACSGPASEQTLPLANETDLPLRVSVIDSNPRTGGELRRRNVELPAGQRITLELRFGPGVTDEVARFEVRTPDGSHFHARTLRLADASALRRSGAPVTFGRGDLGLLDAPVGTADALQPIQPNLAAGKRTVADEVDPAGMPERAVDDNPKTFWRGLNVPPAILASWAVDLGDPVTVERLQIDLECVTCGFVRIRLTFLDQPLPPANFAKPGGQQTSSLLDLVDHVSGSVVGQLDLTGSMRDHETLAAAPPKGFANVRMVIVTVLEGPENVGLYDVRLGGPRASGE